jgi:hypothetical protein
MAKYQYKMIPDTDIQGAFRVEGFDETTNKVRITIFGGEDAEKLAAEYLAFKTGKLQVVQPVPVPMIPIRDDLSFTVVTPQGDVTFTPSKMDWSYDHRVGKVSGKTRPVVTVKKGTKNDSSGV